MYQSSIRKKWRSAAVIAGMLFILLSACEKEVHIKLDSVPPVLVVQGQVETGLPPVLVLTNTIGFFSTIDLGTLQNSFVHGAAIQVSDGTTTIALKEYSIDTGTNNKFYFYTIDTANLSSLMIGQAGKWYTLTINYNGQTYTSTTKVPYVKGVDSLWFGQPIFKTNNTPGNALQLFANYTDPDTPGNYVRYYTRINNQLFYPSAIFSDQAVNGKPLTNIELFAGFENVAKANGDSLSYFYPGDTVTLKWCEIDKGVYTFWNTYQFAQRAIGNPFSSPVNVQSNISNGALGVWAGYSAAVRTIIAPQ